MDLHVRLTDREGLAAQIYGQVRSAILDGRLLPGEQIPGTRELASRLAVSRNTVAEAYDRLVAEGFLAGRAGVGTFVSRRLPDPILPTDAVTGAAPVAVQQFWIDQPEPPDLSRAAPTYDFRTGLPDARLFPYPAWRRLAGAALRATSTGSAAQGDPAGAPALREAIARHVLLARGVPAEASRVVVTNGIQQGIDLACRVLLEQGDTVVVEDPGYAPARRLLQSHRARVVGVPVDDEGLMVDRLPDRARLVLVTPSHQYPLGVSMSLERRIKLLQWAQAAGAMVLEDDYDSEFRYAGRPLEPLASLDMSGRVIYLGSFSKSLLPTLRLGYCIAPSWLSQMLRKAKFLSDWHTAWPVQQALAGFISDGSLARHVRRMRGRYQERRDRILDILARHFAGRLDPIPSVAGLHLCARLGSGLSDRHVAAAAARRGVAVHTVSGHAISPNGAQGLMIGYGAISLELIDAGLRELRACFDP